MKNETDQQRIEYEPASIEIIRLEKDDVVTASNCPAHDPNIELPYIPF